MTPDTKQAHTPGPWRSNTMRDGSRNIISGRDQFVCEFSHENGADRERAEADGALIAAAPDLLDLAEAVVTVFGDKLMPTHTEKHLLDGARAAIAKARGGQS